MCLILFAWRAHPDFPLVVAANRDERHARPTARLEVWDDAPGVVAGRDLVAGGTWLGVERRGRFAALTNHRDPERMRLDATSRGALVADFLCGEVTPGEHASRVFADGDRFNGFNLLVADRHQAWWCANRGGAPAPVPPGVHGISNGLLDEPWPKVTSGRDALRQALTGRGAGDLEVLLSTLADRAVPPDGALPDTGVGLERERLLGPRFIVDQTYGTRSSTAVTVDRQGLVRVLERSFDPSGRPAGDRRRSFRLDS